MATLIPNEFTSYWFSEDEGKQAAILTNLQKQHIHNLRSDIASEKLRLVYDPQNPSRFIQQEADLKGKLEILNYLLECSAAAEMPESV